LLELVKEQFKAIRWKQLFIVISLICLGAIIGIIGTTRIINSKLADKNIKIEYDFGWLLGK